MTSDLSFSSGTVHITMLVTAFWFLLPLLYRFSTPAITRSRAPRCAAAHALIEDTQSCHKALDRIPFDKINSPFFHDFPLSTTLRSGTCIVEVQRLHGDEAGLYTPGMMRQDIWPNVEKAVEDILEFCFSDGVLRVNGIGVLHTGTLLLGQWYPYKVIVRGAAEAHKEGSPDIRVNGSPFRASPPPRFDGTAYR